MPRSIDEWARDRNRSRDGSVGGSIVGAVGGQPRDVSVAGSIVGAVGGQSGGSVGGSIAGAVQQQTGQSGGQGSPRSIEEWAQDQQESRPQTLDEGQRIYEQRKQAQAEAQPWKPTLLWLGEMSNQAEQARLGQQIHPQENATTWEDVKDAWEASRKANRAADYAGRDKLIKEYNAARHEMGAQRHTPEPEVQRRYEQARDRLYEQERIHGNIGLNANGELQTMSYSFGEGVGNVIGGVMGRVIGGVGGAATWLGEAAARSEYAKSAAHQRELAAFYAMTGNENASEGASRMADTLTQRAAQRGNLEEFGGAYSFFDKQAAAGNRLVQAAKENQRPVVQMGVDVGSTALEMGFDAVSGSPLVSMGVRVFGGSSQEAREAGAGFLQQGAYGAASASIEVMTEMIGGLKLYGGGQLDEVLEPALREIAGTRGGYALLRAMYTMAQEGNEEVLSDLLQPLAQSIYNGQSVGENYSELQLKDILYDWLLGAASAFGGAVVESGGYAQDYKAMREMQQDLNAHGVETGRMTDEQLRQAYTLDKAGVNVAGLQSAENRAVGGETIGEAYNNMTPEQREAALVNMLRANEQRSEQTQTPTDEITRETAQEILRESLGEREAESAERILDLGSERNLREQAIAYHAIATEYGQTEGRSVEDALRSNVRGALNDTQVQHAYAYGESLRKSGQTVGVSGQVTENGTQTARPARRAGLVTAGTFADGSTTYKAADLSKADARDLRILNDIAKAQGVDIVLYETELGEADAEGRRSYIGANGAYRNGVVYLDINAGLSGERTENGKTYTIGQRALLVTAAHELTHHLEHSNPTMYRQLRSFVSERLGGSDSYIGYVKDAMARENIGVEAASREVVARACEEVLLDEDAIRELQGKKPTLWEQIKEWVQEFVKKFESASGEAVEMRQYADELRRLWLGAANEAQESAGGTADVVFAEGAAKQTGSGADISHSLRENGNITARTMAYLGKHPAAHISAEMIETANGIINEMTDYMLPYLDKDNTLGRHYLPEEVLGTTIFSDSSYGKSVENTTICFRTLAYIDFTNEIKKRIGRPLTVQESFLASQMLYDIAKEPQCLYCYVSLDRKAYDEFLGKYLKQRDGVLKAFGELSSEEQTKIVEALRGIAPEEKGAAAVYARIPLYAEFLKDESGKKRKNTAPMRQRFGLWISTAAGGKGFITAKDLTTAETRNALKEGELAEQVLDAERYAQAASWAKKLEEYRAYNGNILNMSQETVDKLNESYGLRFYSFSEYSAAFIVENMQQIRDAAAKGLYGLAYTKKPDFARIFAGTGININISTFGRWGVDAQGKRVVVMDDLQGANWDEVKQLRDNFKNVGAVFVATDDAMVDWALAQDWIDVVIPFHIVRTGADVANFYKWVVHNQDQADKTKKGKAKDITPPEHQNDRATFLALAKERGLTPRFSKWLGNEHYMKLVNETRQPTKNSTPLKPVFDLKAAKQSFDDFVDEGGYYGNWYKEKTEQTGPVAYSYEEAVDQVVSDVKAGRKANEVSYGRQDIDVVAENFGKARQNAPRAHGQAMGPTVQRSVRDREYSDAVARGDMETAQVLVNRAAMDAGVIANKSGRGPQHLYHGTPSFGFTEFRPGMIFLTDNPSIAAGYTANKGYGRKRKISETYAKDDGTDATLLKNIKNVLGRNYRKANQSDVKDIVDTMRKSSDEMNDKVNDAWHNEAMDALRAILGDEYTDEFENKLYTILALPGSINENLDYMFENPDSPITEDIRRDLERWDDYRNDIRPLFVKHHKELTNSAAKGLRDLMIGYDLADYLIDAQYSMLKALDIGNMLVTETGSLVSKDSMREAVEQAKDIGAYDLYAQAGDNPLVVDGKGAFWTNIEVPELGGTFMTDDIGKLAKEKGYTSVHIKNIMDSSMNNYAVNVNSDVFIFFDSSQVKSADPVTYDDNGEVIPLSQRFDSGRNDIRFSVRENAQANESRASVTDSEQFKRWFKNSKIVNADGTPRVVYHQTFGGFTSFSNENPVAGANDSETPNGYFFKQNDHDIGLDGKQQLAFYLKIENPLHFKDRKEANAWYQKNIPGYKALQDEMNRKISPINKTIDELDDAYFMRDEITEEQYDQRWNALIAQMAEIENRYRGRLRGLLDDYFLKHDSGYDGIELDYDGHRYVDGKREDVHTYIAFKNTQMKSATDNVGTFDETDSNFQHSVRSDAMTDREILMLAEAYSEGQTELAEFRDAMARYQNYDETAQEHLQKLSELQKERKTVTDMRTSMGEITPQEKQKRLSALDEQIAAERREATKAEQNAARALDRVTQLEKGRALQDILVKERAAQRQRARAQVNESTRRRDTRRKVEKLAKELQTRVAKPSEKRYIPADLMRQTVDVLQAINLDSSRPGTKSGEALRARLLEMQEQYRALETDETYKSASYDPIVAKMLKNMVQTVGDTPINKMSATQLESVYNTLRAMTHVIQTSIKVKLVGEERDAWEVAHDMTRETRSVNKPKDSRLNDWLNQQLSAERMFRRLGNYTKNSAWEKVFRMLNDGQLKMTLIQMEGAQIFADLIGKENEKAYRKLNSYKEKDLVDVGLTDVDGNSIKISHGMMVSLYMHLLNEQNASHVARGGLTIPDLKGYYTSADDRGFGSGERRAVGVSAELAEARREQADAEDELREAKRSGDEETLRQAEAAVEEAKAKVDEVIAKGDAYVESLRESIEKQLTDYERDWIAATQELMDGYSKDRLNETTLEVYGIKKARVDHYFPIKSDRNFTRGDFEAVSRNMSLENVGFMKERVGGTNPMYLMDISDVVNTQISNVAQYCGLMPAIRSFNNIWNKSEAGNTVSLKDTVNQKFGQGGLKYVENLIADLQGARRGKSDGLSRFLSGMRGNMAGANLTISLNTALAQAASYPTAAAEIGWTPLIKAFFKGGQSGRMVSRADRELIAKYTPLLWTRLQGYSTVELGDLAGNNQLAGRVFRKMRFITGWIQAMDTATVGRLWYAAQYYVDAKNPDLQKGSDAYYKETAKVFNDIVEKTQPDYTTMQRPDILRHPNELVRSLTMFMTQRLQNFNIVYDSIATAQKYRQDYRNGQANGVTAEDVKQAQHEARRAVVSQIAAGATIVVFKTLSGILQHALDGYRDDDKELTEESISLACLDMFLDTMASNFLWGGELYDVIESAITGNRYYGLEVNGVQSISDILSTSQSLFSMLRDYKTLSWDKAQPKFITLAKKLGPALGLPIGNAVKLFKGIWLWGQEFIHAAEDGDMLKAFDFEEGVERGAGIEANRYVSAWLDGDRAKMREIIGGLGVSMTSFNSQLSSEIGDRYKDGSVNAAQAIRMLQELRGMTPEEAAKTVNEWKFKVDTGIEYDKIKEQLLNGSISVQRAAAYWQKYGGMSAEDATLKANYVAACGATPGLADNLSQTQYKGWYNNVRSAGVKVDVYAEIRSTASTDGNSNVSQAEAAAAITRAINARQLTPAQAQAVWQSFSSSWKTTYAEYIAQNK